MTNSLGVKLTQIITVMLQNLAERPSKGTEAFTAAKGERHSNEMFPIGLMTSTYFLPCSRNYKPKKHKHFVQIFPFS